MISAFGSTIVVGTPEDYSNSGSAYVYFYDGNEWVQHGEEIFGVEDDGSG